MSAAATMPKASPARARKTAGDVAAAAPLPSPLHTVEMALAQLDDHPDNPRAALTGIRELADTIEADGRLLQALVVVPLSVLDPDAAFSSARYVIVAGHRRRAAVALLGWESVRVEIRTDLNARAVRGAMLTENLARVDLTALEEAAAFQRLVDDGWSQREIGATAGCTQSHVSKRLLLLRLPVPVRAAIEAGTLTVADAVELGKLPGHTSQARAWERATTRKHGGYRDQSITSAIREERQFLEREQKYAEACEQVRAAGWNWLSNPPARSLSLYAKGEISKHTKGKGLLCHSVYIESYGTVSHFCTQSSSHKGKGGSASQDTEAVERRERVRAIKIRTAAACRLSVVPVPADDVVPTLAAAVVRRVDHAASMRLALGWLRADGLQLAREDYEAERTILHGADRVLLTRYALTMVLADREVHARWTHGRWQAQDLLYVHELARRVGYLPTSWELDRLRSSGVGDVDAFLASPDPRPHLPVEPGDRS